MLVKDATPELRVRQGTLTIELGGREFVFSASFMAGAEPEDLVSKTKGAIDVGLAEDAIDYYQTVWPQLQ